MTKMKFFRTLFIAAALVSTHWMGMSMARAFAVPSEPQAVRIHVEQPADPAPPAIDATPVRTVVAG